MANRDSVIERGDKEEVPDAPAARAEDWGGYSNSAQSASVKFSGDERINSVHRSRPERGSCT